MRFNYIVEITEVIIGIPVIACMFGYDMLATLFGRTGR